MYDSNLLILVDGSSYLFRAYHAYPNLSNSSGQSTGAIFGVAFMLKKLLNDHHPAYMAVVFDAKGKNFRHRIYPEYKANRPPMPDDLREQVEPLHRAVEAMGLPLLCIDDVEADDVIGTLAVRGVEHKLKVLISTGDKDMAQLVNDDVTLINTMTDTTLDRDGVKAKFDVWPEQIIDWLTLVGDSSDNIPGVPKCGPKTAAKWLNQYPTLDELLANANQIKGKVGENLRDSMEQIPISRELATIRLDVALDFEPESLKPRKPDTATLREIYQWMESPRLLATLDNAGGNAGEPEAEEEAPTAIDTEYETLLDQQAWDRWFAQLEQAELFAFDTETTSLNYMEAEIVGVSFAVEAGKAAYLPLAHRYPGAPDQLDRETVLQRLKPLLEDPNKRKVGQNLKYDMSVLKNHDIELRGIAFDTMLESYVLDSTATRHDMDSLAEKYLHHTNIHFQDIAGKGARQLTFDQIPLEQAGPYAAEDADITLRLHQTLWSRLEQRERQAELLREIETPLVPVLSRMERTGVRIDKGMLAKQSQRFAEQIKELEEKAYKIAGKPFNMGSPKQIGQIFFDELGLPVKKKTPKGAPSTAEAVLEELAVDGFELPRVILDHRGLSKLKSTYTDKLPRMINPRTGRVHTSYHQAVAATGRLSSSDPNLQNIPIRREEGRRIRRAFIPEAGWTMLAADYSQIELRIMAHLSGDDGLLNAFRNGEDIHRATAAEVFGETPDKVSDDQRRSAKAINFGLIYGMSAFGLSNQIGVPQKEAKEYIDRYFERYPGVRDFMDRIRAQAHDDGYVETLFGRRLYLPEINSRNHPRRSAAERTAINAPMQGTASDIIKRAMITVDGWIQKEQPPLRMLMQVHDELVFEVEPGELDSARAKITALMQGAAELAVPLIVDCGSGANWDEAH